MSPLPDPTDPVALADWALTVPEVAEVLAERPVHARLQFRAIALLRRAAQDRGQRIALYDAKRAVDVLIQRGVDQ